MTDRDRPAFESGVVTLLDGRIEGVHVDVDDLADPLSVHRGDRLLNSHYPQNT